MANKTKLKKIFDKIASPEEKAIYALKNKVKELEQKPAPEKVIEKTEIVREVEKEVTGEYIILKINELEPKPEKQIDFIHIKNFPWHLVKGSGEAGLISWGGTTLQTDGTANGSQTLLNLVAGTNINLTDDGVGGITIDASTQGGETLAQTLAIGNTTGANDIVVSTGQKIIGQTDLLLSHANGNNYYYAGPNYLFQQWYDGLGTGNTDFLLQGGGTQLFSHLAIDIQTDTGLYGFFSGITNSKTGTFNFTALTDNRSYTFPDASGTIALTSDLTAYANTALSNLASVAINTTLVSDTDNTDDIGTSTIFWRTGYFKTSIEIGATDTTLTRAGAGDVNIEGNVIYRAGGTDVPVADGGTGASTLTGLLQGNGTSAFTAITNSSTVGQVLRVTGASTYAWGALDLTDGDAITGALGAANGGTGISSLGTGVATWLGSPTAANLQATIVGTTGTAGSLVFSISPTFATSITGSYLTASEILITDSSKNIVSAPVATYPSLTELTYLKGVTSSIQTQLGAKQPSDATLTAFAALTIAADSLTIGTGADAFSQTTFAANTFPARASTGNLVAKTITDFGLSLIDDAAASDARTTLGLGTIATEAETNYALLAGRSGGQSLIGGTASGDDLTLTSTSNATKGNIFFGANSTYDDLRSDLGIGTLTPGLILANAIDVRSGRKIIHVKNAGIAELCIEGSGGAGAIFEFQNTSNTADSKWIAVINDADYLNWLSVKDNGITNRDKILTMVMASGNIGMNTSTFGTSGIRVFGIGNGTAPTTSPADMNQMWSADTKAGDSNFYARNEAGTTTILTNIKAFARSTAQTTAVASVATYTVGSADSSFEVSANVLVTTATTHNFTVTCAYTDEGNTARTLTLTFGLVAGGVAITAIANANGAVPYMGVPIHIRCKASTAITIATTGTFTTVTYNVEGIIKQLQ